MTSKFDFGEVGFGVLLEHILESQVISSLIFQFLQHKLLVFCCNLILHPAVSTHMFPSFVQYSVYIVKRNP